MKRCFLTITILVLLLACQDFQDAGLIGLDEADSKIEIYGLDFKNFQETEKFRLLDIDKFDNFRDLVDALKANSCKRKITGLNFTSQDTVYHLIGNAECPDAGIACYFNNKHVFIENDSIISFHNGNRPIEELSELIGEMTSKRIHFQNQRAKPFLIHLWIHQDQPIALTKKVLKNIAISFDAVSRDSVSEFFKYQLLFGSKTPPPPPPPVPFPAAN